MNYSEDKPNDELTSNHVTS